MEDTFSEPYNENIQYEINSDDSRLEKIGQNGSMLPGNILTAQEIYEGKKHRKCICKKIQIISFFFSYQVKKRNRVNWKKIKVQITEQE